MIVNLFIDIQVVGKVSFNFNSNVKTARLNDVLKCFALRINIPSKYKGITLIIYKRQLFRIRFGFHHSTLKKMHILKLLLIYVEDIRKLQLNSDEQ